MRICSALANFTSYAGASGAPSHSFSFCSAVRIWVFTVPTGLPVASALALSVTDFDLYALADSSNLRFVGLGNYVALARDPEFRNAFKVTFQLFGLALAMQLVLGALIPNALALQYPTETALATVLPMQWSLALFRPFIRLLNGAALCILRMLGAAHATGVERVLMMPDRGGIRALLERTLRRAAGSTHDPTFPAIEVLDMDPVSTVEDTFTATRLLIEAGVSAIAVLGGDGTHRAVVRELRRQGRPVRQ